MLKLLNIYQYCCIGFLIILSIIYILSISKYIPEINACRELYDKFADPAKKIIPTFASHLHSDIGAFLIFPMLYLSKTVWSTNTSFIETLKFQKVTKQKNFFPLFLECQNSEVIPFWEHSEMKKRNKSQIPHWFQFQRTPTLKWLLGLWQKIVN